MAKSDNLQLYLRKEFDQFLRKLKRRGGLIADAVYNEVVAAIECWRRGMDPGLRFTHHGESRIDHAVKYDLRGRYRLIVYEHARKRIPLMVGDHEEADRWLKNNSGRDFTVNNTTQRIAYTVAKPDPETTRCLSDDIELPTAAHGPVLAAIQPALIQALGLSEPTLNILNRYATFEGVEDGNVWELIQSLEFPSKDHREIVTQAIARLARGEIEEARERIELFLGNAETASDNPKAFADALDSGCNSDILLDISKLTDEEMDRILKCEGLTDWMLYLHPDQRRVVEREYNGPARLIGVSGSGKTSVMVHRANFLAKKYPGERILILSLNAALCRLLETLFDTLCSPAVRKQIDVMTIYAYCYQAVKIIAPGRLIEKQDLRSGEDLPTCWREFLEKQHAIDSVYPIIAAIEARKDMVDGPSYILDELIWIRSGFGCDARGMYLMCDRPGRGIPLPRNEIGRAPDSDGSAPGGFPLNSRNRLLSLLEDYEEYMRDGGLLDNDGVSLEAYSLRQQIAAHTVLRARCVLVDEVQDCSTVELAVIAQIPTAAIDGLFLTGDPVQKVFPKQHDLVRAQIDIVGRGEILRRNYRNTREILEAAYEIITAFKDIAAIPPSDILQPEYAFRNGARPTLYECTSWEEQRDVVLWFLSALTTKDYDATCIGFPAEKSLQDFANACEAKGIPTFRITDSPSDHRTLGPGIKLSLLQDMKGYEFARVFLVDLMDSYLLPKGMPWEERWRIAFQVYVAMTRAREDLVMCFVFNRSILLGPLADRVDDHLASKLLSS
ncbi:MAG: UvrD-helicase domain-containing protein [Planctomycetota bacterium]